MILDLALNIEFVYIQYTRLKKKVITIDESCCEFVKICILFDFKLEVERKLNNSSYLLLLLGKGGYRIITRGSLRPLTYDL